MSAAAAELFGDGGAAVAGEEFFRSAPFFEAEGVTHTLRITSDSGELLAPVIVGEIPGTGLEDAVSPYGYPGLLAPAPAAALDPATIDFSATGLVSLFLRHRLGADPPLAGAAERNIVQIADPARPRKSRMSDRQQIRKNLRRGYEVEMLAGPASSAEQRRGFLAAYEQTMRRAGASERYFFGAEYFDRILSSARSWLALARSGDGEPAAASIAVRSDAMLHYYLSGTADTHLRDSPMKNIVSALTDFAAESELPLNLGGGLRRGDRLEEFKRGFANREDPWHTSEVVCDAVSYERLAAGRDGRGFFPVYRSA